MPESPKFLCHKGKYQEAKNVLNKLYKKENDVENQLNSRLFHVNDANERKSLNIKDFFSYGNISLFVPLYILAAFQQFMGGYPLYFYIIKIFKTVGEF